MKNIITWLLIVIFLVSCSPSVTVHQAANRNYKSTRGIK